MKESIDSCCRRERKNMLISHQPILQPERMSAAFQRFVARQPVNSETDGRAETGWQSAPQVAVANGYMPGVTAEQFVGTLTDQCNLHVLPRALRDEIHGNYGRRCNWFFQACHDLWKRSFEFGPVEFYGHVTSTQGGGRLLRIDEFVVREACSITYRVGGPGAALFAHQCQEKPGVETTAEEYPYRHVAKQMSSNSLAIQLQKLMRGLFILLGPRKRKRHVIVPPFFPVLSIFHNQHGARGQLPDSVKDRQRRRRISKAQEKVKRNRINGWLGPIRCGNRSDFRSECQLTILDLIVDEF